MEYKLEPVPCYYYSTTEGEPELYLNKGDIPFCTPAGILHLYTGAMARDLTVEQHLNGMDQHSTNHKGSIQQVSCHHQKGMTTPYHQYAYLCSCLVSDSYHIIIMIALCTCQFITVQDHVDHSRQC